MGNYNEELDFIQGSDSGDDTDAAVQPVAGNETLWPAVNRAALNVRRRAERLRQRVQELSYYADYDRALLPYSTGTFALVLQATAPNRYKIVPTNDLWVYPALTPGLVSGGRDMGAKLIVAGQPYAGTVPNELKLVASQAFTGQRGYADGGDLATAGVFSLGANGISVELVPQAVAGGPGSIAATVSGTPERKVRITYGTQAPATTASDLVAFINGDATSQGAYGLRHMLRASTTTGSGAFTTALAPTPLEGGYDAEAFQVTAAQFADFFATSANLLRDGDGLAIAFPPGPVETGVGATGGRRQSIFDLPTDQIGGNVSNVTPAVGNNLFNTAREPEKIPGAIPIGKLIGGEFVFVDGTRLQVGTPVALGSSAVLLAALGSTAPPGAALVGYGGSGGWNADAALSAHPQLAASTVEDAIDNIVSELAENATGESGARRLGMEAVIGAASPNNVALAIAAGSIRQALSAMLNTSAGLLGGGGLNARVSERGHYLKGKNPLIKDQRVESSSGGGVMLQTYLNQSSDPDARHTYLWRFDTASLVLQGIAYSDGVDQTLTMGEPFNFTGAASNQIHLSAMNLTRATYLRNVLIGSFTLQDSATNPIYTLFAELRGVTAGPSGDGDGVYFVGNVTTGALVSLVKMNGSPADFTGAVLNTATMTFHQGHQVGSQIGGARVYASHMNLNAPYAVFTAAEKAQPLLIGATSDAPTGNKLAFHMTFDNLVFRDSTLAGSHRQDKDTNHILIDDDYKLLNGIERGGAGAALPIDASNSHHHGLAYTRTEFLALADVAVIRTTTALSGLHPATTITGVVPALLTTNPIKFVICDVEVKLVANGTPALGTAVHLTVTLLDATGIGRTWHLSLVGTGTAAPLQYFNQQMIIPVNTTGEFKLHVDPALNINGDLATSTITITQVGWILGKA